jgi:RNA polymerase sigma-70 factor (ECF subfamily)
LALRLVGSDGAETRKRVRTSVAWVEGDGATPADKFPDDAASLVERLVAKSSAALGQAYDLHHESVRAFTRRLLGDDAAAEDLVQETFIALPAAARKFDGSCSLKTFLTSIAVNRARHHLRAAARRRSAMARLGLQAGSPQGFTPEEQVGSDQMAEALVVLLDQLPVDQRIAFVLCEVEERTSSEVAVIVGASQATVRSRVFHAKRKLREALARGGWR